ncbi:alpha/beta hydrolase [Arthrobacter sp. H35-D1]|uniref:alpha/beta fold hydrolase n=1 Tax=Arthrobacter sp. H35-D1 TaxID=3046202 RepID=UPI0024BB8905|nr:alpha/beta hydrolase [Arthrobacter sp. H35-D1]MDJ0314751.1 alpha/beta hydrolase [Arthrobacter sp. H35-D1]
MACGSGQVVAILHGLAGESGEFAPTMAGLAQQFRAVALDRRGHGRSTRRPSDVSRRAYVQDVVALIEHVGPDHPIHLVGQSMGAHTAMLVAAIRPDLVQSLVLLEGDAGSGASEDAVQLGTFFASWPVPFADDAAAREFLGNSSLSNAWANALERRSDGLWPRFDADIMMDCLRAVMEPRWDEWSAVEARTLVMYADNGMFTDEQKNAFLSHRPGTLRVDLEQASHDAHLDEFEQWITALKAFLMPRGQAVCDASEQSLIWR